MNKILALWGIPRSTSTAFEWMMRQRGDMQCYHEPFGEAWYQGEDPMWPRLQADSKRTPGLTLEKTWEELQAAAAEGQVFIKDFPHHIDHMWDDAMLDKFTHSFLIRDPAKTVTSVIGRWPDVHLIELGFVEQRRLFDYLCDRDGTPPPVVDSDDLLEDPHNMVERWSNAVGIPFMPESLSWEPGARDEVSWWDGGSFHANLRDSDGLKPQVRKYVDISEASDHARRMYELCLPHYEHLYQHRLTLTD